MVFQIFCYFSFFLGNKVQIVLSILRYASVSTQTSVLIIGGYSNNGISSFIVEYKDDKWTVIGNLNQARYGHQAISIGSLVMIIGGRSTDQL